MICEYAKYTHKYINMDTNKNNWLSMKSFIYEHDALTKYKNAYVTQAA